MGKFINDSPRGNSNARMRIQMHDDQPKLILYATKLIPAKTEIRYNYDAPGLWWRSKLPKYNKPFKWEVRLYLSFGPTAFIGWSYK